MFKENLAAIIITKQRSDELSKFFLNLNGQSVKPSQTIVVDAGSDDLRYVFDKYPNLEVNYVNKVPPSITGQRNVGIGMLRDDITLVAFFDDDSLFENDSIKHMMEFWQTAPDDVVVK